MSRNIEIRQDYDELIKWLRYCASDGIICEAYNDCPFYDKAEEETHDYRCDERMTRQAANAIEELQEDNAALNGTVSNLIGQIEELSKPKWIPVTERLPSENDRYLTVSIEPWFGTTVVDIVRFGGGKWMTEATVTYWMPLPPPPKEE